MKRALNIVAAAVLVAVLGLYLWPDETLTPDGRRMLMAQMELSPNPDALHYGLWGFEAPSGEDIWAHGRAMVDSHRLLGEPLVVASRLRFTREAAGLCRFHEPNCLDTALAAGDAPARWVADNAELMARYAALKQATDLRPVIDLSFDTPFPPYRVLINASALMTWQGIALIVAGERDQGLAIIEGEERFARQLLSGAFDLITKVLAAELIANNIRVLHRFGGPIPARLSSAEHSILRVFHSEAAFDTTSLTLMRDRKGVSQLMAIDGTPQWFARILPYQPNRTINRFVANVTDSARASALPPTEIEVARVEMLEQSVPTWEWWINTAGAVLTPTTLADFLTYPLRLHDLDALIVLAQVADRMREEGVTAGTVEGWLDALPSELHSPYGDAIPQWRDGVLSFPERLHTTDALRTAIPVPLP